MRFYADRASRRDRHYNDYSGDLVSSFRVRACKSAPDDLHGAISRRIGYALAMYRSDFDEVNCRYQFLRYRRYAWCRCRPGGGFTADGRSGGRRRRRILLEPRQSKYVHWIERRVWWAPFLITVRRLDRWAGEQSPAIAFTAPANDTTGFLMPYIKSSAVFKCPDANANLQCGYAMSYIYNGPMGANDGKVSNPGAFCCLGSRQYTRFAPTRAAPASRTWQVTPTSGRCFR